jgi:outer membrane immunogenic protein
MIWLICFATLVRVFVMTRLTVRLSAAAAVLASVSAAAIAADLEPPPPPMRPATYDWTGPYIGGLAGFVSLDGHYDKTPDCPPGAPPAGCVPVDPEMSGSDFLLGGLVGWNYDFGGVVAGVEGDWAFTFNHIGQNREPAERTTVSFDNIATLRARVGKTFDRTLAYITGGVAFVDVEFAGEVGPVGGSVHDEDSSWVTGWTIGGGLEHAFTDYLHGRMEYLYIGLPDEDFRLEDPNGFGGDVTEHFDAIHMVRAALTYNFSW